jgi:hypothetical protein
MISDLTFRLVRSEELSHIQRQNPLMTVICPVYIRQSAAYCKELCRVIARDFSHNTLPTCYVLYAGSFWPYSTATNTLRPMN